MTRTTTPATSTDHLPTASAAVPIPVRPRLGRRCSSAGSAEAPAVEDRRAPSLLATSAPSRKPSYLAINQGAPFSDLLPVETARSQSDAPTERRGGRPPPPFRSTTTTTTIVRDAPPACLKRKASLTARGRFGGGDVAPATASSSTGRLPRRPATATTAGGTRPPLVPSASAPASVSAAGDLPASVLSHAFLPTASLVAPPTFSDTASSASSSTEHLPRAHVQHSRERSMARSPSQGDTKPKPRSSSSSTTSGSESLDKASGASSSSGSTLRSGLLKLKKSTKSLRNAFRASASASSTTSARNEPPLPPEAARIACAPYPTHPPVPPLPLSPTSKTAAAAAEATLVISVAHGTVDHSAPPRRPPLSPTTPRTRAPAALPALLPGGADRAPHKPATLRRARSRPAPRTRPSTSERVPGSRPGTPPLSERSKGLRRAMSTSELRRGTKGGARIGDVFDRDASGG